jgi:hypothetical protein
MNIPKQCLLKILSMITFIIATWQTLSGFTISPFRIVVSSDETALLLISIYLLIISFSKK